MVSLLGAGVGGVVVELGRISGTGHTGIVRACTVELRSTVVILVVVVVSRAATILWGWSFHNSGTYINIHVISHIPGQ